MNVYWLEQSEAGVPSGDEWLAEGERSAQERLLVPKRRAEWRLGRWTAKRAVAAYAGRDQSPESLAGIEVRPRGSGAPEALILGAPCGLSLSLSHSNGLAFCALAAGDIPLGCDVEKVERRSAAFVSDYFTAEEQESVMRLPPSQRDRVATLLWSAKESALKALQSGLRIDTRSVAAYAGPLAPFPGAEWRPLMARDAVGRDFRGWWRDTGEFVWTALAIPPPLKLAHLAIGPGAGHRARTKPELAHNSIG